MVQPLKTAGQLYSYSYVVIVRMRALQQPVSYGKKYTLLHYNRYDIAAKRRLNIYQYFHVVLCDHVIYRPFKTLMHKFSWKFTEKWYFKDYKVQEIVSFLLRLQGGCAIARSSQWAPTRPRLPRTLYKIISYNL